MLNLQRIQAISLDLDDTLWPIWPTIERAEALLHAWLATHAPATATLHADAQALRAIREAVGRERTDLRHDLAGLRRESIRRALVQAGDDPTLAGAAFEVFFEARNQVTLFADCLPGLEALASRWPLATLTNGNADIDRIGLGRFFRIQVSARSADVSKPDSRIFHAAARSLGVPPESVLHVGDDATLDVLGAQDAGMQAVWVNREEALWPHEGRSPDLECLGLRELCEALGVA
jgi:putative hydrolase of the HAD superfamily